MEEREEDPVVGRDRLAFECGACGRWWEVEGVCGICGSSSPICCSPASASVASTSVLATLRARRLLRS